MSARTFRNCVSGPFRGRHFTGRSGLTDITFAGQRHVMPLQGPMGKTTGRAGISQRKEREMACSNPQSMDHPHCILCGDCMVCDPHPAHTQ